MLLVLWRDDRFLCDLLENSASLGSRCVLILRTHSVALRLYTYGVPTLSQRTTGWCNKHLGRAEENAGCMPRLTHRGRDKNGRHFADDILGCIFLNENVWIVIKMWLNFVPKGPINNILVQIMAWRRIGDKQLSEPMMVSLPTHIRHSAPMSITGVSSFNSSSRVTHIGFIMAWRMVGSKPWSEPMLKYCQLDPKEHISMKLYLELKKKDHSRKRIWKFRPITPDSIYSFLWRPQLATWRNKAVEQIKCWLSATTNNF